ncbi:hypothetical protein NC652_041131 [Populus alba x Populus x berolinensis]|nr:hypothetical protein NC652_041131 [Populus alba x Populus x berolinensis]
MAPEKLAELWALDPNEPKAGISKRDTSSLTTENSELKLRLQAMEQQAELRDEGNKETQVCYRTLNSLTESVAGKGVRSTFLISPPELTLTREEDLSSKFLNRKVTLH